MSVETARRERRLDLVRNILYSRNTRTVPPSAIFQALGTEDDYEGLIKTCIGAIETFSAHRDDCDAVAVTIAALIVIFPNNQDISILVDAFAAGLNRDRQTRAEGGFWLFGKNHWMEPAFYPSVVLGLLQGAAELGSLNDTHQIFEENLWPLVLKAASEGFLSQAPFTGGGELSNFLVSYLKPKKSFPFSANWRLNALKEAFVAFGTEHLARPEDPLFIGHVTYAGDSVLLTLLTEMSHRVFNLLTPAGKISAVMPKILIQ